MCWVNATLSLLVRTPTVRTGFRHGVTDHPQWQ